VDIVVDRSGRAVERGASPSPSNAIAEAMDRPRAGSRQRRHAVLDAVACAVCGATFPEITLGLFSFNNPRDVPASEGWACARPRPGAAHRRSEQVLMPGVAPYGVGRAGAEASARGVARHYSFELAKPGVSFRRDQQIILYARAKRPFSLSMNRAMAALQVQRPSGVVPASPETSAVPREGRVATARTVLRRDGMFRRNARGCGPSAGVKWRSCRSPRSPR